MGQPRFSPSRGWWFQMKDGLNQPAAFAFLQWLQSPSQWQAPKFATAGMAGIDKESASAVALSLVSSLPGGIGHEPELDPDAAPFNTSNWGTHCGRIAEIANPAVRFVGGNGRIAYAAITSEAKTSGGEVVCRGSINSFLVLRKRSGAWKVLLMIPSIALPQAVSMGSNFDQLRMVSAQGSQPTPPSLLSPYDGEPQTRFPKQDISWQQNLPHPAAYVVESRFGVVKNGDAEYGTPMIHFVDPAQYGDVVRMPMPFGVGMQPHRWRVWAVGQDGEVAVSEWRTVDFTN